MIATGGYPDVPRVPGAELGITSDGFFELEARPQRVAVVGSGYVACELASAFQALGSEAELFIRKDHLLTHFDVMLGKSLMREMLAEGLAIHTRVVPGALLEQSGRKTLVAADGREFPGYDCVLWAIGRSANVAGLDLRAAGVALDADGFVATDAFPEHQRRGRVRDRRCDRPRPAHARGDRGRAGGSATGCSAASATGISPTT